jgi:hypothetical protein
MGRNRAADRQAGGSFRSVMRTIFKTIQPHLGSLAKLGVNALTKYGERQLEKSGKGAGPEPQPGGTEALRHMAQQMQTAKKGKGAISMPGMGGSALSMPGSALSMPGKGRAGKTPYSLQSASVPQGSITHHGSGLRRVNKAGGYSYAV